MMQDNIERRDEAKMLVAIIPDMISVFEKHGVPPREAIVIMRCLEHLIIEEIGKDIEAGWLKAKRN